MAHRRKASGGGPSPPAGPMALAAEWARAMGRTVQDVELVASDAARKEPALGISHGPRTVFVRPHGGSIAIWLPIEIPAELRKKLATLDDATQEKFLLTVHHTLLGYGRTGYSMRPSSVRLISEVESISVEQEIRISRADLSSFNRFGDAIQEVVTAAVRVVATLQPASSLPATGPGTADTKPPSAMYA